MAVLDHHNPKHEINGYVAVGNCTLVFLGVLALAYVFSLLV